MKKEYKELFSKITPDEKLLDGVLDKATEKRTPMIWKKAGAAFLAMAMLLGCGGYFALNQGNDDILTTQEGSVSGTPLNFSIIAYANGNDKSDIKTISETDITLMDGQIKIKKDNVDNDSNGYYVSTEIKTGLSIKAKDISEVTFESRNGYFDYFDNPLREQWERNNEYYSVIIPLTKEEGKEYIAHAEKFGEGMKYKSDFIKSIMDSRDCSEYFGDNSTDLSKYSISYSYDDNIGQSVPNAFLLRNIEKTSDLFINHKKSFTAKTYSDGDVIRDVTYYPEKATDYLIDHPHTPYTELPSDEITITVKFKSGQSITKKLNVSFNKDGKMQFEYIK